MIEYKFGNFHNFLTIIFSWAQVYLIKPECQAGIIFYYFKIVNIL